jgi:hypothetical protein
MIRASSLTVYSSKITQVSLIQKRTYTVQVGRLQTKDPKKVALVVHKGKEHSLIVQIVQGYCDRAKCCMRYCTKPCEEIKEWVGIANATHSEQVKNETVINLNKNTDFSGQPRAQHAVKLKFLKKALPIKEFKESEFTVQPEPTIPWV